MSALPSVSQAVLLAGLLLQPVFAQDESVYLRSICTKVQAGKGPELEDLLSKNALKASEYNISQGKLARYVVLRNAYPAGSSAQCDYLSSFLYRGAPPETTPEITSAAWAAAKTGLSYSAFLAKLNSIGHTVRVELFAAQARTTGSSQVGDYIALNRMKVHDTAAWKELETRIWKPMQEARIKDGQLRLWSSFARIYPSGTGEPYSAITVDIFPSWDAMFKQKPLAEYMRQIHPNMTEQEFSEKTTKARDLVSREVYKEIPHAHVPAASILWPRSVGLVG
jgi:hypothetical protein